MYFKVWNFNRRRVFCVCCLNGFTFDSCQINFFVISISFTFGHDIHDAHFNHFLSLALNHEVGAVDIYNTQDRIVAVEEWSPQIEDDVVLLLGFVVLVLLVFDVQQEFVVAHVGGDLDDVVQGHFAFDVGHFGDWGDVEDGVWCYQKESLLGGALVIYLVTTLVTF